MILACYPGTGKTTIARTRDDIVEYRYDYPREALRKYPLTDDELAELLEYCDERAKEIRKLSGEYKFLLMQPDMRLFSGLNRLGVEYTIVIPDYRIDGMRDVFLKRYEDRGTVNFNFLDRFINMWDARMQAFELNPAPKIYLGPDEYVSDVIHSFEKANESI